MIKSKPIIKVLEQDKTGRNIIFSIDGIRKTLQQTVKFIEDNPDFGYHIRVIYRIKTPVSNPDKSKGNNLG